MMMSILFHDWDRKIIVYKQPAGDVLNVFGHLAYSYHSDFP